MSDTVWVGAIAILGTVVGYLLRPLGDALSQALSARRRRREKTEALYAELRDAMGEAAQAVQHVGSRDQLLRAEVRLAGLVGRIADDSLRARVRSFVAALQAPSELQWNERLRAAREAHDAASDRMGELLSESRRGTASPTR